MRFAEVSSLLHDWNVPMKRVLIVNPAAGSGEQLKQLRRDFESVEHGRCDETECEGDARTCAAAAVRAGAEVIIAAGGDGTIHEVVNGMMDARDHAPAGEDADPDDEPVQTALGIIPMGTANDFARTVDLPTHHVEALHAAVHGKTKWIDLIRSEHLAGSASRDEGEPKVNYLINAATGGFSRVAEEELDREKKQLWGVFSYLRVAVQAMGQMPEYEVDLEVDGQPRHVKAVALVFGNGRYAGGGMQLVPDADVTDRRLDLVVIEAGTLGHYLKLGGEYLWGSHLNSDEVEYFRAKRVVVRSEPTMHFSSDGEPVGQTPIEFRVVPRAIPLRVPAEE